VDLQLLAGRHEPPGALARADWASYLRGASEWRTVLDIDALVRAEGVPWAFGGATCLPPENRLCLVRLSRGGADAVEIREFDTETREFVPGGFHLPEAKQNVAWFDADALLVSTDFGPGTMTTSGYARMAKLWRRGTPLAEADLLFEAVETDMSVGVGALTRADRTYHVLMHRTDFYTGSTYVLEDGELVHIDVPLDATTYLAADRLLVYLRSPWEVGGRTFESGALIDLAMSDFLAGSRDFRLVLQPGDRQSVSGVVTTRDHVLVSMLDNLRSEIRRYSFEGGAWSYRTVPAPEMGTVRVVATSPYTNRYFFTYSGYTQPTTVYLAEEDGSVREVQRLPAQFDAAGLAVAQYEATSRDGTRIPYFVVHPEDMEYDGGNPTLLYAYGGFQVAQLPGYNALTGSAWLERGGVYVVANIRGGGEFGPAWHRAALKENRQRAYDDFTAVAEDLVARRITSPARLGIMGGSNGGLLVGVAFTQRPDLYGAVVVQVPLLDMRRYNRLLAGASWMAEYGDPDVPEEWEYIRRYSPYHNLREGVVYPVPLFVTTTRDDRVHPGHARKMAARMESMGLPFHYFENTEGGHGSGVTSEQRARSHALTFAYLWERLGDRPRAAR
jgi:prolyl oligopeptidase